MHPARLHSLPLRLALLALSVWLTLLPVPSPAVGLTVAAANSTCGALSAVVERYRQEHGVGVSLICKASGRLAKGLHGGAISAHLFISANRHWMDVLIDGGLVEPGRVVSPWGNALVVAAPVASPLQLAGWEALASAQVTTLYLGDPGTAPFGRYAKQALEHTGLWPRVRDKVVTRKHITLLADALARADGGSVGILFRTNLDERLRTLLTVDPAWHPPIRYYLAPLGSAAADQRVAEFAAFLLGPVARERFGAAGFMLITR
ncbi:molybdate ABC transporter substrate-binding protein [Endothiovibrio diazotrophicus]